MRVGNNPTVIAYVYDLKKTNKSLRLQLYSKAESSEALKHSFIVKQIVVYKLKVTYFISFHNE